MIVRHFLQWVRTAEAVERAEATSALARAYLYSDLTQDDRIAAEGAMIMLLDDPSPLVRRALAEAFANAPEAPRHLVVALANDQSDIATLILSRSPVLPDADLVDCAALGGELVQTAIALRPTVSVAVSAALAEIASAPSLAALAQNAGAAIPATALARMVERHGDRPELREALLARADLPLAIRQAIAAALSASLSRFVTGCGWLSPERTERIVREAREKTTLALSSAAERGDVSRLVLHLRRTGQLTPALILRALLSRSMGFAEAAFADLSGLAPGRVGALLWDRRGAGFAPLYRKAGLPPSLQPAFEAALSALRENGPGGADADGAQLSRLMIERVLTACRDLSPEEAGKLMALLRRFEAEAARDEARHIAGALADEAALAVILEHAPRALLEHDPEPALKAA